MSKPSQRGKKQSPAARLQQNFNSKKFTTPNDDKQDRDRLLQGEIAQRNLRENAEPFWNDNSQVI